MRFVCISVLSQILISFCLDFLLLNYALSVLFPVKIKITAQAHNLLAVKETICKRCELESSDFL